MCLCNIFLLARVSGWNCRQVCQRGVSGEGRETNIGLTPDKKLREGRGWEKVGGRGSAGAYMRQRRAL
jgi:hypothetical protein